MDALLQNIKGDKYYTGKPITLSMYPTGGAKALIPLVNFHVKVDSDALVTIMWDTFTVTSDGTPLTFGGFKVQYIGNYANSSYGTGAGKVATFERMTSAQVDPATGILTFKVFDTTKPVASFGSFQDLADGDVIDMYAGSITLARKF